MPFERKTSQWEPTPVRDGADVFAEEYRRAVNEANAVPPPGSDDALAKGCTCPVLDNGHGQGYLGQPGVYVYVIGCPVHCPTQPFFGMGTTNAAVRSIEGGERG